MLLKIIVVKEFVFDLNWETKQHNLRSKKKQHNSLKQFSTFLSLNINFYTVHQLYQTQKEVLKNHKLTYTPLLCAPCLGGVKLFIHGIVNPIKQKTKGKQSVTKFKHMKSN